MKIKKISIYKNFHCTGADCPVSCCKGWRVPIDPAVYQKYLLEKGAFGVRLRHSIREEDGIPAFRRISGRCPFWGRDRLCSLQKKHGTEYMPQVCVQFPRQLYHLGFFCEETLYLACPEAARLFLFEAKQGKHFPFEETTGNVSYEVNTTNDDKDFLEYLLMAREQLIEMLDTGCRYNSILLLNYGRDAQNACLGGRELPSPLEYKDSSTELFALDCADLNNLFFHGFYHPYLRTHSPLLYQLCNKYIKELAILGRINQNAAAQKLAALKSGVYQKIPELDLILNRYYEYQLQTGFLNIFEDYSFSKHLLWGMTKADVLWLLIALFAKNREVVTMAQIADIIAVFERRAPQMKDRLFKISQQKEMQS